MESFFGEAFLGSFFVLNTSICCYIYVSIITNGALAVPMMRSGLDYVN